MIKLTRRAALMAGLVAPGIARAQSFPARAVRIVVPFPPGGAADITARLVGERMTPLLGQPVVIDNRPGAGGNIAGEVVARSAPDGYTLFLGGATILLANKYLFRNGMPFDGIRDFAHVSRVSVGSTLFVVNANRPWKTFEEFMADAKRRPGQITAASSGLGTISHLSISKLMKTAGIDVSHVPYRGLVPGLNDLLAGNVDMIFDGMPALMPHVREGKLRALAVGSQKRQPQVAGLENVRGMAELIPGSDMDMEFWYCISAPAGTPALVVHALHRATIGATRDREYGEKLIPLGFTAISDDTPEGFTDYVRSQDRVWRELVEISGAKLD